MNLEFIKKQIKNMDVKSEEFFDLYITICEKYYSYPDPDEFQKAAMTLRMYIDKSVGNFENQLIAFETILTQLFKMDQEGSDATGGTIGFKDKSYSFMLSTSRETMEQFNDILGKVLKGNFKTKGKKND